MIAYQDETVTFVCHVDDYTEDIFVEWFKNGNKIANDRQVNLNFPYKVSFLKSFFLKKNQIKSMNLITKMIKPNNRISGIFK